MAAKEKRRFIGFDIEDKYCQMANNRAAQYLENRHTSILAVVDY
jgi:DNA modification methylase